MTQPGNAVRIDAPAHVIRPAVAADLEYVIGSWAEGYKNAPRMAKLTWQIYKQHVKPQLIDVLRRAETQILVADAGDIVGWIAFAPGRRVSTCHWVHTRYCVGKDGPQLRKHGVMASLLDAAQLGSRFCYTHKGPKPVHRGGPPADEWIVRWLAGRGVTAAYVPMEEWKR